MNFADGLLGLLICALPFVALIITMAWATRRRKCPNCNYGVSPQAENCPHCGERVGAGE